MPRRGGRGSCEGLAEVICASEVDASFSSRGSEDEPEQVVREAVVKARRTRATQPRVSVPWQIDFAPQRREVVRVPSRAVVKQAVQARSSVADLQGPLTARDAGWHVAVSDAAEATAPSTPRSQVGLPGLCLKATPGGLPHLHRAACGGAAA